MNLSSKGTVVISTRINQDVLSHMADEMLSLYPELNISSVSELLRTMILHGLNKADPSWEHKPIKSSTIHWLTQNCNTYTSISTPIGKIQSQASLMRKIEQPPDDKNLPNEDGISWMKNTNFHPYLDTLSSEDSHKLSNLIMTTQEGYISLMDQLTSDDPFIRKHMTILCRDYSSGNLSSTEKTLIMQNIKELSL